MAKAKSTKKTTTASTKPSGPKGDANVLQFAPILKEIKRIAHKIDPQIRISEESARLIADMLQADLQSIFSHAVVVAANDSRRPTLLKRDVATVCAILGL